MTATTTTSPVDRVLALLEGVIGHEPQWEALCPAHHDRTPSLSIGIGDDGRALLCCQAGCDLDQVLAALKLTAGDLFPADQPKRDRRDRGKVVARYPYTDEAGELLYEVVRFDPKDFRQRRPDGRGGWEWRLNGVRRVLYRLPEVRAAIANEQLVWITEGEKDADALAGAGEVATCSPQGAGKWDKVPDAAQQLTGATVIIWADDDEPGHDHARQVARTIDGHAEGWIIVRSRHAKDAAEHLGQGRGINLDELDELAASDGDRTWLDGTTPAPEPAAIDDPGPTEPPPNEPPPDPEIDDHSPADTPESTAGDEKEDGPTTWAPIDVVAARHAGGPPPPDIWQHARGHHLLYAGRTHAFFGASETLKSWAAQAATAEVLNAGGDVFYIDYEDDAAGVGDRLHALGVTDETITRHLLYVRPDEPILDRQGRYTRAGLEAYRHIESRAWRLGILDGITEAMTTEGLDPYDNADSARFQRRLLRPIANRGAAAVGIDHQAKNVDGGNRFAIGAQHKLSGLTGAAYRFEAQRPLGRPDGTTESIGLTRITVSKDRPGFVRGRAHEGQVGTLRITSWPDGKVDAHLIDAADLGDAGADMVIAGKILKHLTTYEGETKSQLEKQLGGNASTVRATRDWLIDKGWIEVRKGGKPGTPHRLHITDNGRQETPE